MIKLGLIVLLILNLYQAPAKLLVGSQLSHLRYRRSIAVSSTGASCAILDAEVFAHAAPSLKDLRLFAANEEIPYVITLSETAELTDETAVLLGVQADHARTVLDLQMPPRPYTDVNLDLDQQDFVVTAAVSGSNELISSSRTPLGNFTLFDLTGRHLSRSTVLPLQESTFRYLHVELHGDRIAPRSVLGAQIPPSRQAQTLYTPVVQTSRLSSEGHETVATIRIPAHVPLERVSIELPPRFSANFDRVVRVTGQADGTGGPVETIAGTITNVNLRKIHQQKLSFEAAMGINLQKEATIHIAIENGNEAALPVSSVKFEMRRRSICFSAPSADLTLFYGNPSLTAPRYPPSSKHSPLPAMLSPEIRNPDFVESPQALPIRHADLFWLVLLAAFGAAGTIALHTLRKRSLHRG